MTITHSDATPPAHPSSVLRDLVAEVAAADHGLSLKLQPVAAYQAECDFCDPTGPAGVVIATIAIINRFDHLIRRTACAGCVHDAIVWATSEGRNVTIRAAVGTGTR